MGLVRLQGVTITLLSRCFFKEQSPKVSLSVQTWPSSAVFMCRFSQRADAFRLSGWFMLKRTFFCRASYSCRTWKVLRNGAGWVSSLHLWGIRLGQGWGRLLYQGSYNTLGDFIMYALKCRMTDWRGLCCIRVSILSLPLRGLAFLLEGNVFLHLTHNALF